MKSSLTTFENVHLLAFLFIGVRDGSRGVAPPGLKNFRANSVFQSKHKLLKTPENKKYIFSTVNFGHPLLFRASASCSKLLNVKSIFNTVKNFREILFFRASASCSKILNDKKYFNTVKNSRETLPFRASASCSKLLNVCSEKFQGNSVFSGQAQVTQKSWMIKNTYLIQWKFQGNSVFQGKRNLVKILNVKSMFHTVDNSGQTLFFRASASCSKIPNDKKYFNAVKNFRATLFFRASTSCSKILNNKKYIQYRKKFQGKLFSGQAQVVKNPKCKNIFNTVKNFRATPFFQGKRKLLKNRERWKNFQYSVQGVSQLLKQSDWA